MSEDIEYPLKETGEMPEINNERCSKKLILRIIILIAILIVLVGIILVIYFFAFKKSKDENEHTGQDNGQDKDQDKDQEYKDYIPDYNKLEPELLNDTNITFLSNVSYAKDKIKNTFKIGGANFNENIGNLNNGEDYQKNERNVFDIYFPDKNVINLKKPIILFIHGGGWIQNSKEISTPFCLKLTEKGYITVNMGYTLINQQNTTSNIFRMLDEISTTIASVKKLLSKLGYNENELNIAIGGESSGGHVSLLYGYLNKQKTDIPVKFIINLLGPVTLEYQYYYKVKDDEEPLDNIDPKGIEEGKDKLEEINNQLANHMSFVYLMYLFLGEIPDIAGIGKMTKDGRIIPESEEYQKLLDKVKYSFPVTYINKNSLPTLNVYSGKDSFIGVKHYAYLLEKAGGDYRNVLMYSKPFGHESFFYTDPDSFKTLLSHIANFTDLYIGN